MTTSIDPSAAGEGSESPPARHDPPPSVALPPLGTGDVIACWGTDWVSLLISLMTINILPPWSWRLVWGPSHVAIIHCDSNGKPWWYESTMMVDGKCGVQAHEPAERWAAYKGRCVVYQINPRELGPGDSEEMGRQLLWFLQRQTTYDIVGALLSGTRILRWFTVAGDSSLFCSEMVCEVLQSVGVINRQSATALNPLRLIRQLVTNGTHHYLPRGGR